jgi:hypothetical protein
MSRIPEPQPSISLVLVWTQLETEHNIETNQLRGLHLLFLTCYLSRTSVGLRMIYVTEIRRGFRIAYFDSHTVYLVCLHLKVQW